MRGLLEVFVGLAGRGVVHRDVKLENVVMFGEGTVGVVDFGACQIDPVYLEEHRENTD